MNENLSKYIIKYKGKWLALDPIKGGLLSTDNTALGAKNKAKKNGVSSPLLVKAPSEFGTYVGTAQ